MTARGWDLVGNPDWNNVAVPAQPFTQSGCHDGSHFVTVQCRCGEQMHMHESATRHVPADVGVASNCKGCGRRLEFPPSYFAESFDELRRRGWIT